MSQSFQVECNIVYGTVSGMALLGDLYRPGNPNGIGWHAPVAYNAIPLK